jgi:hypothetical protein
MAPMGRSRSPRQGQPQQPVGAQAAVAVALVETAGASRGAFVAAVAPLLLPLIPAAVLAAAGPALAAESAEEAAKLLYRAEAVPVPSSGFARTAALEAISYRAAYAAAAVRRLCASLAASDGDRHGERSEALRRALAAERRHLGAHLEMTRKRLAGAKATDGMVELHGWVLNWRHGATRTPAEPRPAHLAADGANVDLRRGLPAGLLALPGVLPWCSCAWGPPVAGARMLLGAGPPGAGGGSGSGGSSGGSGGTGGEDGPLRNFERAVIPRGKLTRAIEHET